MLNFFISVTTIFLFLFLISLLGMFINKKNILVMLMSLEMLFLSASSFFVFSSIYLDDVTGQIFAILILTVAASESAIGLAILVIYYRIRNSISVELMDLMKG
uniref:NADH dehydrogenase subunit 4L n=1 Tax=Pseudoceramium inkyui TaxID=196910 RepID=UPI002E78763A|nr:NADH dehydrogenase subunit 4L [Pseudoceramium inkyui]WQF69619.1 NADH dehydrogenase subunit 4L [Pseudoceramium inkyui]